MFRFYLAVFELCSYGCTQIPGHSYFWNGYQCPLCARCLGVLLGAGLFAGFFFVWKRLPPISVIPSTLLMVPLIIDGAMQLGSLTPWANEIRLFTGILFPAGAINLLLLEIRRLDHCLELTGNDSVQWSN